MLESPQLNAAMAAQIVAANLHVIRDGRDVEIIPDEPGDHVVEILRDDIDNAITRAIASRRPGGRTGTPDCRLLQLHREGDVRVGDRTTSAYR
jgi:hypothetical protein